MLKLVSFVFLILLPAYSYAESKVFTDSDLESYTRPETEQDRLSHQKRLEEIRQSEEERKQTEEREKEIGKKGFYLIASQAPMLSIGLRGMSSAEGRDLFLTVRYHQTQHCYWIGGLKVTKQSVTD